MKLLLLASLIGVSQLAAQTSDTSEPSHKTDHPLRQFLIEAAVIELASKDSERARLSLFADQEPKPDTEPPVPGSVSDNGQPNIAGWIPTGGTNSTGAEPSGFDYLARLAGDLDALITTIATNSRVRILQRPRIQTSEGQAASIFVGESRAYPTSGYYCGGACSGYSSIQQLQMGITLTVTPNLKPDRLVEMDINQRIDRVAGSQTIANVGDVPITTSTEAQAKVIVGDRETLLIGGLIETNKTRTAAGVPLLKNIPVLGALFRKASSDRSQNELIVLIRPTLLPSPEIAVLPVPATGTKQAEIKR